MSSILRLSLVLALAATALAFAAGANASGRVPVTLECDGSTLTLLTQPASHDNFGAVQVVGDGTLIPLAFAFNVTDVTKDIVLFSGTSQKGGGSVPSGLAGSVSTCTETETGPLSEFLEPGEEPPPGTDLTDIITFTLTATVVKVR